MLEHRIDNSEGVLNTVIITAVHGVNIGRCLKTFMETVNRQEHRIIFIDSPSKIPHDLLYSKIKDYIDVYIKTEKNYGFSKSINLALGMVYTPYFTVIHDDCWFIHKGWWNEIKTALEGIPDMIMMQPTSLNRRGPLRDGPEFISEEEYQKILASGGSVGTSVSEVYCMVFKKEWLDLVGLFDESIFTIGPEDLEFWRLSRAISKSSGGTEKVGIFHKGVGVAEGNEGGADPVIHPDTKLNNFYERWGEVNNAPGYGRLTGSDSIQPVLPAVIRQL